MSRVFGSRLDEIDVQIEKIARLIDTASVHDPELAAGLATTESLASVQHTIDQAAASCEALERSVRNAAKNRRGRR